MQSQHLDSNRDCSSLLSARKNLLISLPRKIQWLFPKSSISTKSGWLLYTVLSYLPIAMVFPFISFLFGFAEWCFSLGVSFSAHRTVCQLIFTVLERVHVLTMEDGVLQTWPTAIKQIRFLLLQKWKIHFPAPPVIEMVDGGFASDWPVKTSDPLKIMQFCAMSSFRTRLSASTLVP